MTIERMAIVRAAPAGERDGPEPQVFRGGGEMPVEIEMPGPGTVSRQATARHHLRPNFIARPANSNSAMHYDIS